MIVNVSRLRHNVKQGTNETVLTNSHTTCRKALEMGKELSIAHLLPTQSVLQSPKRHECLVQWNTNDLSDVIKTNALKRCK